MAGFFVTFQSSSLLFYKLKSSLPGHSKGGEKKPKLKIFMRYTYIASDNSDGDATAFNAAGNDCYVKKIIFGDPTDGDVLHLYNKVSAGGHASGMGSVSTNSLACKIVQPTHAEGCDWVREVTFSSEFNPGLQLDGGCVHTDGDAVTIIWDDK